jgi:hypothetical protein
VISDLGGNKLGGEYRRGGGGAQIWASGAGKWQIWSRARDFFIDNTFGTFWSCIKLIFLHCILLKSLEKVTNLLVDEKMLGRVSKS